MSIYNNIKNLCDKAGITTYRLCKELGFSTALMSQWKNGRQEPSRKKLEIIAAYFDVPIEALVIGEMYVRAESDPEDEELTEYLQALKENPGMRILFSKTKNASKEDIEKVIKMFEIIKGESDGGSFY